VWDTALAFAIWGSYGSLLTAARIDPVLTAIVRSAPLGAILVAASAVIARVAGPRDITATIPWRSGTLWLSGAVLLVLPVVSRYCTLWRGANLDLLLRRTTRRDGFLAGGASRCAGRPGAPRRRGDRARRDCRFRPLIRYT
jgi:hypothetical protein